jgi:hypothetical protein
VYAHIQTLDSIVKMANVFEECITEELRSVVRFFCGAKGLNAKDIHKKNVSCLGWECFSA